MLFFVYCLTVSFIINIQYSIMTEIEMKRCIARYSEAFDVLLKEVHKMKERIEALEGRDSYYDSKRVSNSDFGNGLGHNVYMKVRYQRE